MNKPYTSPMLVPGEPVAIVGISCMFPKAPDLHAYWGNIKTSQDAITDLPQSHWKPEDYFDPDPAKADMTYARRGGFLEPVAFNPLHYGITPNAIEATDSSQLLAMMVTERALVDADYAPRKESTAGRSFDRTRTSVMLGVTGALELVIPLGARLGHPRWRKAMLEAGIPAQTTEDIIERIAAGYVPWQEQSFPGLLGNVTAGRIANKLDLGGANCVVDAACASSIGAIHMAVMELSLGRCDMAISGGVDTFNDIFMYMCFSKTPALSTSGSIRPFSDDADGTMLGEGIGVLVLKRLSDAQRDGDRIHAIIKGIGASSDGTGNAIYAPSANGQARALRAAYRQADVSPGSIELVEAHGTGTQVGDQVEADALSAVYTEAADSAHQHGSWCALGSVKSMIGHTKAAAGVAGIIKSALALQHKVLPPTIKVHRPVDAILPGHSPIYLNTSTRPWVGNTEHPRRAAVSAFGFGGSNFHCVLEEAQAFKQACDWVGDLQIVAFSAPTKDSVCLQLNDFRDALFASNAPLWMRVRQLAKDSRERFTAAANCRLIVLLQAAIPPTAAYFDDLSNWLIAAEAGASAEVAKAWYGEGQPSGTVGVVFPGQGSQRVDMLKDLSCLFPSMLNRWEQANKVLADLDPQDDNRLSDYVYPVPVFDTADRKAQQNALRATSVAQPALAAACLGAMDVLQEFNLQPQAFAGHSFGELTALCAAGVISAESLLRLARRRGQCMEEACESTPGGMLAVSASIDVVEAIIDSESLQIAVANHNSPGQVVISGDNQAVRHSLEVFASRNITAIPLDVAGAFHSPLMRNALEKFTHSLDETEFKQARQAVYSNVSTDCHPTQVDETKVLLAAQICAPVRFVTMIHNMYEAGVQHFVEVGPGKVLHSLIGAILKNKPHQVIALDTATHAEQDLWGLAGALAQLAAIGHEIDLKRWDPTPPREQKSEGFTVQICGANNFQPKPVPVMRRPMETPPARTPSVPAQAEAEALPKRPTADDSHLAATGTNMELIHTTLLALQKMQQETSDLHRQYLASQQSAQRSIELLIRQQLPAADRSVGDVPGVDEPRVPAAVEPLPVPVVAVAQHVVADATPPLTLAVTTTAVTTTAATTTLFDIVADKTGYPRDVLTLEMSLDADLGIDSIKRVEIFSALGDHFPALSILSADEAGSLESLGDIAACLISPSDDTITAPLPGQNVAGEHLLEGILDVVADKTGYPPTALQAQMRLDEDLGIDSIKRVEILSALQDRFPDLPGLDGETAGSVQTLQDISDYLSQSVPVNSTAGPLTVAANHQSPVSSEAEAQIRQVFANKTGYPEEMLDNTMQLDADLGIDSIKRVEIFSTLQEIFPHAPIIEPDTMAGLLSIGAIINYLGGDTSEPGISDGFDAHKNSPCCAVNTHHQTQPAKPPTAFIHGPGNLDSGLHRLVLKSTAIAVTDRVRLPLPDDAVIGIFADNDALAGALRNAFEQQGIFSVLIQPDREQALETLTGLLIVSPQTASPSMLTRAFAVMQKYGPQLQHNAVNGCTLLATVSRLNGQFGLGPGAINQPISAGLGGLLKTAAQEWPQISCKSIDISPVRDNGEEIAAAIVAEMLVQGPLEVGLGQRGPITLELHHEDLPATQDQQQTTLLNEGDLVVISGGARGISAAIAIALAQHYRPALLLLGRSPEPEAEAEWLRNVITESGIKEAIHKQHNGQSTPRQIQAQYQQIVCNRDMLATVATIEAAGAQVEYRSVDIRDQSALSGIVTQAQSVHGPLQGIVHGAGIIADSLITDKTIAQFEAVLSTKCDGFMHMLASLEQQNPVFIIACSSTTARLGRKGQADYAAANECLNKLAQQAARQHPGSKVLSVNWGPWDGGMVDSRLKGIFQQEGVGLIPLQAGSQYLLQELQCPPSSAVELVVMGPNPGDEAPSVSTATNDNDSMQLCFNQNVSLAAMPILQDHVINSRAVVPVALMIEWLAHGALHHCPGLKFTGLEAFKVCKGIIIEPAQQLTLQILAATTSAANRTPDEREIVYMEIRSNGDLHACAKIHLGEIYPLAADTDKEQVYAPYQQQPYTDSSLFHGPRLQGISSISGCDIHGISGEAKTAPAPAQWINEPLRTDWLADPLVLDASFQMMILWTEHNFQHCSLPTAIGRMELYGPWSGNPVRITAQVRSHQQHKANASIEFRTTQGHLIAHIEDYECVIDESLTSGFDRNTLVDHS